MKSLELNLHQLILSDIARNIGESKSSDAEPALEDAVELVSSKVETRNVPTQDEDHPPRVFMSSSRVHCNIGFGELAVNMAKSHSDSTISVLIDILRDIPFIDFDKTLSWTEWALSDQLVFSTVSSLLRLAMTHNEYRSIIIDSIFDFAKATVLQLSEADPTSVISQFAPSFHGFYRAIISTPFPWILTEWSQMSLNMNALFASTVVERLNNLLIESARLTEDDPQEELFVRTLLSRYVSSGRPLTGYFVVCCVIEIQETILAQTLSPPQNVVNPNSLEDAAAANAVWTALIGRPALALGIDDEAIRNNLRNTIVSALRCYADLLLQIEELDGDPSIDTYAWETMSESLKLASVCSVALQDLDNTLFSRLQSLLSDLSPVSDALVQESALEATTVLVHNFPSIAADMAHHLRRFITSPLPIFEIEYATASRGPPPLLAAAKCLAVCIKRAPGDDLIISNMYSLLNYIAATSQDVTEGLGSKSIGTSPYLHASEHSTIHSVETGLRGRTEEEKHLIGISTISVVTRLALEFQVEEVTRLTISMLLQRIRTAEPIVEAAIAHNLVDLALSAPENAFLDIIRIFSSISRAANPEDSNFSNNVASILTAQTRLARGLYRRPDLRDMYLQELLVLFADKGVGIQTIATSHQHRKTDALIEQLSTLVLPIAALMEHEDFTPDLVKTPELVGLFRNMWFLCVLFRFTSHSSVDSGEWSRPTQRDALYHIAMKTPPLVREDELEYVTSVLEYNSVIRQDFAQNAITYHRDVLTKYISLRASEIRYLHPGQIIFLLVMHDIESMRSVAGLTSSLVTYFVNNSLNKHNAMSACMDSIAEKVMRDCQIDLSKKIIEHSIPRQISSELRKLLVYSCHRIDKTREVASRYLNRLITSFPSLICGAPLVFAILEILTILRRACEGEYTDEFNPVYEFTSARLEVTIELTDSYSTRNEILTQLHRNANNWFTIALARAPIEFQATLQKYLTNYQSVSPRDAVELGASIALQFGISISANQRGTAPISGMLSWKPDRAKALTSQIACKEHFAGEPDGFRLGHAAGAHPHFFEKIPPNQTPPFLRQGLKTKMSETILDIQNKTSILTIQDLKRLLFRCASMLISTPERDDTLLHYLVVLPYEIFTPAAISAGIEAWTWLIGERTDLEMSIMLEFNAAWMETIKHGKGMFCGSLNAQNPFYNPIEYSPTDRADIDRAGASARRLLIPHTLLLQMLLSRFQAVRYSRPGLVLLISRLVLRSARAHHYMSTHPLARENRFCFLTFGFETLKSTQMDFACEHYLRKALYSAAFSWFSTTPQWSFGSDRVQLEAEIKVLNEFLLLVQGDSVKDAYHITALDPARDGSTAERRSSDGVSHFKDINQLLRLLVEDEISRLCVWRNPMNDARRGGDHPNFTERTLTDMSWKHIIRTAWKIDPVIAVHLFERFKHPIVESEVGKWVRSNTRSVLGNSDSLRFLLGDHLDSKIQRDLKVRSHLLVWAPVTPVTAVAYFEPQYRNDPIILQYAHRVLEQHPVDLTFFFVPQVVQALRNDSLGYVERFIFETAQISQLFCHQIIWNMKANCFRDDAAEVADPMKPILEKVMALVVNSLSGEAKTFYTREFGFFNEVTSISGKLKPYIKKSKSEKKAKIDEEMAKIEVDVGVYLPSNPDGVVVDIDKKSGRPLQSHAKAPFMATFKVRKKRVVINSDPNSVLEGELVGNETTVDFDIWQQAIFKVGDDCRQDVLALQIIAMFKNVFTSIGLTLYLYPYRVTATAPGCGVIDVVPNATSRDEMGRAKINDLLAFFTSKYGAQDTIAFQRARLNFIQSMAAYSVACYILQIKDRHNGNIMIDGEGHIIHIGMIEGVKFEPNSFKLNHEMVTLMGGRYSQGYSLFVNLTIKAFLAIRPYAEHLISTVHLMLGTGLPSFKGEPTMKRLRDRFALGLNEREAADFMMKVVKNAHENMRSMVYDEFQWVSPQTQLMASKLTNTSSRCKMVSNMHVHYKNRT
ncbi:atypical/PIKK/PI4K protein kinase [Ramaria rubella]|nr:atypical/PIKK/PI4K protein kinase [Ramaria rubella]